MTACRHQWQPIYRGWRRFAAECVVCGAKRELCDLQLGNHRCARHEDHAGDHWCVCDFEFEIGVAA